MNGLLGIVNRHSAPYAAFSAPLNTCWSVAEITQSEFCALFAQRWHHLFSPAEKVGLNKDIRVHSRSSVVKKYPTTTWYLTHIKTSAFSVCNNYSILMPPKRSV